MFKPRMKDAISLARMCKEQLARQGRLDWVRRTQTDSQARSLSDQTPRALTATVAAPKRLSWEEAQRWRSQGICFHSDEKFTFGHKCRQSQLLRLEGDEGEEDAEPAKPG